MQSLTKKPWKVKVVPFDNWRVLKGDRVQVISGKNKGMRGEVKQVLRARNQVVVEGVNLVKKHQVFFFFFFFFLTAFLQAGSGEMKGGVYTKEAPISGFDLQNTAPNSAHDFFFFFFFLQKVASVALIDPGDNQPCKTRWVYLDGGLKERQSKRSNLLIPKNELVLKSRFE
jgi:large subunit ribosomal protein L24